MLVSELQSSNAFSPIVSPLVITTVCKFVFGIYLIANVGIVTLVSELHPENAE